VARAGASTVFELAHYGIPTIFVPYPRAADNHQRLNVEPLLACKAALLCEDSELDSGKLYDEVEQLLASPSQREEMSKLMRNWVMPGAADHAAAEILAIAKKKECELSITTGTRVGVC